MEPFSPSAAFALLDRLRRQRPLVQNITNFVTMTVSANVLLAAGASPAMVHAREEVEDFAAIASSLVVNIGTLSPAWIDSMKLAATTCRGLGKPWVLDPVGVGATRFRTRVSVELQALGPSAIRANASEVMALAGAASVVRGVDSTAASHAAVEAAVSLARAGGCTVAVTGETDYVTDGHRLVAVEGGHPLMPLSTGLGCALSALVAAFLAVAPPFEATVAAIAVYAAAGRMAGARLSGPGHLPAGLCDALHCMDEAALGGNCTISEVRT